MAAPRRPRPSHTPLEPASRLRRSLRACTAEGAVAEVVGACCGGAVLTGWALHLGMSARLVGLITALPVTAQVLQGLGAMLTARLGHRRAALVALGLSRQAFLPLAFLPALPLGPGGQQRLLLAAAGAYHGFGLLGGNAWNAWAGELVPRRLRGRYFGRRTALCTTAGGVCALLAGVALDRSGATPYAGDVLQALALLTSLAGAATVVLLSRMHARSRPPERVRWALSALARPFADPRARRAIAFGAAWNGACGLSAPFFSLYLLGPLHGGYAFLASQGAGYAAAKAVSTARWGRVVDTAGPRRVLVVCTAGLAVSPLAWLACRPDCLWPLWVETAVGGVLLGGHAVASFELPLAIAPARERPFYLAAVNVAGGLAFATTSTFGCALLAARPAASARPGAALPWLLAASTFLRLGALRAALALPRQVPRAASNAPQLAPPATPSAPEVGLAIGRAA